VNQGSQGTGGEILERRTALAWLIKGFLSLWALGAAAVGITFLKAPEEEKRPSEGLVRCGSFSALAVGEARFVRHGLDPIFVVRVSDTQVIALPAVCTHLRCVLKWDAPGGKLLCPCHNGAFDRNGNVLSGPPTRPLSPYRAEIQGDEVVVRT
jgi:cytochrome b6-f complex iron-sulfur subunit